MFDTIFLGKFLIDENLRITMISDDEIEPGMVVTEVDLIPIAKAAKTYQDNLVDNLKKILGQVKVLE